MIVISNTAIKGYAELLQTNKVSGDKVPEIISSLGKITNHIEEFVGLAQIDLSNFYAHPQS